MAYATPDLGDIIVSVDSPVFTGEKFELGWVTATKADAQAFAADLAAKTFDPFLGDALQSYRITRNRDFLGRYADGYAIIGTFRRPALGDDSVPGGGGGDVPKL